MDMQAHFFIDYESLAWDEFCFRCPNANFLHTRKFLSYHKDNFIDKSIVLTKKNLIVGLLPAAENPTQSSQIISHPGITYGGFLHEGGLRGGFMLDAFSCALALLKENNYDTLEYKVLPFIYQELPFQDDLYALFRLGAKRVRCDLSSTVNIDRRLSISRRRVRSLKNAQKNNISLVRGFKYASDIWKVLVNNLDTKFQKIPTHSIEEISILHGLFPEKIQFIAALDCNNVVAGVVLFDCGLTIHAQYIASNEEGYKTSALDLIFDECIKDAKNLGAKYFDFGISTEDQGYKLNIGLNQFKSEFGGGGVVHEFYRLKI